MKERANITVWGSTRVMLFEQVRPRGVSWRPGIFGGVGAGPIRYVVFDVIHLKATERQARSFWKLMKGTFT